MSFKRLRVLIPVFLTSFMNDAFAEIVYLDCTYSEVAAGVGPYHRKAIIDMEKGVVEHHNKTFSGDNVTISPTAVRFQQIKKYSKSTYAISRKDFSYTHFFNDILYAGKCELGQAPKRVF